MTECLLNCLDKQRVREVIQRRIKRWNEIQCETTEPYVQTEAAHKSLELKTLFQELGL